MDPIGYQVYQNRLRESHRSSETLRVEQKKNLKEPAAEPVRVNQNQQQQNAMSGEMLNDSGDFSDFTEQQAFRRSFDEDEEAIQDEEERESGGGGDDEEPEGEPESEAAAESDAPAVNEGAVESEAVEPVENPPAAPVAGVRTLEPPPARGAPTPPPGSVGVETPRVGPLSPGKVEVKPQGTPPMSVAKMPEIKLEKLALPELKLGSGGWGSMLDLSGGFLLAEEANVALPTASELAEACAPEEAAAEETEPIPPSLGEVLAGLVVGDTSGPAGRRLLGLLGRFGEGVLNTCLAKRVKVFLLPPGESVCSHPLVANAGLTSAMDAVYLRDSRSVVLEEACVSPRLRGFHPAIFYFAHAWDHALGDDRFASQTSPAVQASYQACAAGLNRLPDTLAASSPMCYFAQAVESYLGAHGTDWAICTRDDLYDFDRPTYDYVDYLFKRANRT